MKIIKVENCAKCPYCEHDDGGGHCDSLVICDKFNIILFAWRGPQIFNFRAGIHPDCKLEEADVLVQRR